MEFLQGMEWWPYIEMALQGLGSLVVLASVIVGLTPSKKDDAKLEELKGGALSKVFAFVEKFSVIQKKPK